MPAKVAILDGLQNHIVGAIKLSDPAVSVALGGIRDRKSRQGRQRYETLPVVAGLVDWHKDAGWQPALRVDRRSISGGGEIAVERAGRDAGGTRALVTCERKLNERNFGLEYRDCGSGCGQCLAGGAKLCGRDYRACGAELSGARRLESFWSFAYAVAVEHFAG